MTRFSYLASKRGAAEAALLGHHICKMLCVPQDATNFNFKIVLPEWVAVMHTASA